MLVRASLLTAAGILCLTTYARGADPTLAEATARKNLERLTEASGPVVAVALSSDGKTLASGGLSRVVRLWDTTTGKEIRQLEHPRGITCLAFSADRKLLATVGDQRVRVWDTSTAKEIRCLKIGPGEGYCVAFSPDGRTLATGGTAIRLWEIATGRDIGRLDDHRGPVFCLSFSPDGKTLASGGEDGILRLWDSARRSEIRRWVHPQPLTCLAFHPDGKTLAAGTAGGSIQLWDPVSGKPKLQIVAGVLRPCWSLAFSPDARTLLGGSSLANGIRRWDAGTGKEQPPLKGFEGNLIPVMFGPGSGALAADRDPLTNLRNVADPNKKVQALSFNLTADEFGLLWGDLASDSAAPALGAMETLSLDSRQVVPYLKSHLRPEPPFPPLAQLIADLDSNRFPVRQKAAERLERIGRAAEPTLRQALQARPPLEVKRRIEMLLTRITREELPPDQLRAQRAVEVLRRLGDAEARKLLRELAGGAPEGLLTRSAKEALRELGEK